MSQKRVFGQCRAFSVPCTGGWCGRVWYQGGYTRVGTRVGYTGVLPSSQVLRPSGGLTAKRAPEAPEGAGVGGQAAAPTGPFARAPDPTTPVPLGPPGPLRWVWASPRANPASGPITARFHLISIKLVQNRVVSPKYVEKASVYPCFQNGSQKSPLEIPGFPYS